MFRVCLCSLQQSPDFQHGDDLFIGSTCEQKTLRGDILQSFVQVSMSHSKDRY